MISNIQRFCIHDGSGIRTTVFFKGCPLRCAWCANPETQHSFPELMIHHNRCRKCMSCIKACPKEALSFRDGSVQVDSSRCDLCGACRESCPDRVISIRGEGLSPQKILEIVRRDKPFYQASGGGMTLSGGEPLFQSDLALELLIMAKDEGISTCIETSLACPFSAMEKLLPFLDEIYFDLKHADSKKHKEATGGDNMRILENIRKLLTLRPDAHMRIPVIPGFNDSDKDIDQICALLRTLSVSHVELMWYHNLGSPKYSALDRKYPYAAIRQFSDREKQKIKKRYLANGITAAGR